MQFSSGVGTPIYMAPELMNSSKYNAKVDVYSFAMVCWELMAEKQPFHEVKRVWDLPRIVVDGLRPTIDETWPRGLQRLIADCWMQSQERRPTMNEVAGVLREMFEKERKSYEKSKKASKKKQASDSSAPATAHTGNLEQLVQQGMADPMPEGATSDLNLAAARDLVEDEDEANAVSDSDEDEESSEKPKKKAKPKKKKPKKASATGSI